jgi:RND family efflux transporter MFP subunit
MNENNRKQRSKATLAVKTVLGLAGLAGLILWSSGFFLHKLAPGVVEAQTGMPLPTGTPTVQVVSRMIAPRVDLVGTVASGEKINLSARISAYIKNIYVRAGDRVKAGQLLVRLDSRELREQIAAAEAQLAQAKSEYERSLKLKAADATTDQALTAAKSAYETARAQVEQIKVMLSFTEITSPIDGKITDRRVEVGDLAAPGQTLLGVFAPQNMRIEVPVPVRLVEKMRLNQAVDIQLDRPTRPFKGTVTEIVAEVDPMSRTQRMKVHIEGATAEVLLPGTFGRVWISDDPRPTLLVPASAVYRIGQLEMVQVVEGSRIIRRLVKTGPVHGEEVEILSGLSDGDRVVTTPVMG